MGNTVTHTIMTRENISGASEKWIILYYEVLYGWLVRDWGVECVCYTFCPMGALFQQKNLDKHILFGKYIWHWQIHFQFGQIHLLVWTDTFCNLDKCIWQFLKYIWKFGQIQLTIWTNTFCNVDKYCLQFMRDHCGTFHALPQCRLVGWAGHQQKKVLSYKDPL